MNWGGKFMVLGRIWGGKVEFLVLRKRLALQGGTACLSPVSLMLFLNQKR
ncbi:hypothetical protein UC3_01980 [Enterococcus phoeniculicola ATCC BAA-412]|uniref:Uncharacterized protein n=1 Tax=Enterococcus phoeniculicola ATCC BAA-412 TaxID=1158610 RepID=R3TPM5_9ENTE|nr:hypothetical protein UC3_01980 [Enterococcus phoeniculicola ATCC BAA-412]EOT76639.1 hypothetical protein I589_01596 [Enterococcus phoeniculicola ATCC BAA-412]